MYILRRKSGEGIRISKDITVYVLGISGNEVKLGIDAPKDIPIIRLEILETTANASAVFSEEKLREILKSEDQGLRDFGFFAIKEVLLILPSYYLWQCLKRFWAPGVLYTLSRHHQQCLGIFEAHMELLYLS